MIRSGVKLWKHQSDLIDKFFNHGKYSLWFAGCGTGKTLASLCVASKLKANKTLVLTTKTAIETVWVNEVNKWCVDVTPVPIVGTRVKRVKTLKENINTDNVIVIMNYEFAWREVELLQEYGFTLVIADESHKLQSHNSQVSLQLSNKLRHIPYKIAMTGTLMEDRVAQVYGQARFLDCTVNRNRPLSRVFGTYGAFRDVFEITRPLNSRVRITVGSKNLDILADKLASFTITLDSNDVLDLPDEHDIYVEFNLDRKTQVLYNSMLKTGVADTPVGTLIADNPVVKLVRLQQIALGHYNWAADSNPMIANLVELLDSIGDNPVVIFTKFRKDVKAIAEALDNKLNYLTGDVNELDKWNKGQYNVIVVNIGVGSESVDLTRAKYAIYYSKSFSRTQYVQSRYRIRRPPAKDNIIYYHLVANRTISKDIEVGLKRKGELVDYLLGLLERHNE